MRHAQSGSTRETCSEQLAAAAAAALSPNFPARAAHEPTATEAAKERVANQVSFELIDDDPASTFLAARRLCLTWMISKCGGKKPELDYVESSPHGKFGNIMTAGTITLPDGAQYWSASLDNRDSRWRKIGQQRTWIIEAGLLASKTSVRFASRLSSRTTGVIPPASAAVPTLVRGMAEKMPSFMDGRRISPQPWIINTEDQVDELIDLLLRPERRRPVVVLTLPEHSENPDETIVPTAPILRRTAGAGHVAVLTGPATYFLTDTVGKEFSVFHQGVRYYNPGFDPHRSEPSLHPLYTADKITSRGAHSFYEGTISWLVGGSAKGFDPVQEFPPVRDTHRISFEIYSRRLSRPSRDCTDLLKTAEQGIQLMRGNSERDNAMFSDHLSVWPAHN